MTSPFKSKIWKKLKFFFARNEDFSKYTPILNVVRLLITRVKAIFILNKKDLSHIKKEFSKKNAEPWVILHYQRIVNPDDLPISIGSNSFVTPKTFQMHCKTLAKVANIITLEELCTLISAGREPADGTVVVTVDGGFTDFMINGSKPSLEHMIKPTLCIPTAYINSKALLLDDQIATAFSIFGKAGIPLRPFPNLPENLMQTLLSTTKENVPEPKSVQSFLALLFSIDISTRFKVLTDLGEQLKETELDIPNWIDFMTWDDITYLHSLGVPVISKLHSNPFTIDLHQDEISQEISESFRLFSTNSIRKLPIVSLPWGIYTEPLLGYLANENIKYALSSHIPPPLMVQEEFKVKVLSRKTIIEGNSFSKDIFLSTIWDLL